MPTKLSAIKISTFQISSWIYTFSNVEVLFFKRESFQIDLLKKSMFTILLVLPTLDWRGFENRTRIFNSHIYMKLPWDHVRKLAMEFIVAAVFSAYWSSRSALFVELRFFPTSEFLHFHLNFFFLFTAFFSLPLKRHLTCQKYSAFNIYPPLEANLVLSGKTIH